MDSDLVDVRGRRSWLMKAGVGIAGVGALGLGGSVLRAATPTVLTPSRTTRPDIKELVSERARGGSIPPTPSSALGPYYLANMPVRSDIRGIMTGGLPVRLYYQVIDANTVQPISGASVDIWHANACGVYSGFSSQNTLGQNWLRGVQYTDAGGWCQFQSVFPGWYQGRTAHIHMRVRRSPNVTTVLTTQGFYGNLWDYPSIQVNPTVYQYISPYAACGAPQTVNATDPLYNASLVHTSIVALDGTFGLWAGMIIAIA